MKLKFAVPLSLAALSFSAPVLAGSWFFAPAVYTAGPDKDRTAAATSVYAGLAWTLKDEKSLIPDLTLGIRSLRVKSSDQVSGADLGVRVRLSDGLALDSVRVSYVGGQRGAMGNVGIGYSKTSASMIGTFAAQGPFSRLGADYAFGPAKLTPYFEALTLPAPSKVSKISTPGTYSCASYPGTYLQGTSCMTIP